MLHIHPPPEPSNPHSCYIKVTLLLELVLNVGTECKSWAAVSYVNNGYVNVLSKFHGNLLIWFSQVLCKGEILNYLSAKIHHLRSINIYVRFRRPVIVEMLCSELKCWKTFRPCAKFRRGDNSVDSSLMDFSPSSILLLICVLSPFFYSLS